MRRIVLTGFMGSGKTTVGRLLAARLNWEFRDLDREVERLAGKSVPALFAEHGEGRFRELEAELLGSLLSRDRLVLALGGGAPEFTAVASQLRAASATQIVYLAAPFVTLVDRCRLQSAAVDAVPRPLLQDVAVAEQRYTRREPLYRDLAHTTVVTDGLSADESMLAVLSELPIALHSGIKSGYTVEVG